ncbi:hypothetical protein JCM3765_002911 [Sporobolomyces pararoseus]
MSLRPPSTPRASLLPQGTTPRRKSLAPTTPGRPPSALSSSQMSSLRQAVAAHDPHDYENGVGVAIASDEQHPDSAERRKAVLPGVRPAAALLRSNTPSGRRTPTTPSNARPKTPNGFGSSTSRFASPLPSSSASPSLNFEVGDQVTFEVQGERMEGTVRFIGQVDGKAGEWGGVELSEEFSGKGKNDGSVKGVQYFACPPQCGLFLPLAKISAKPKPRPTPTTTTRASKYAGMSAKDLASRRTTLTASTSTASPTSPTKTPRRSLSPTKPRSSLSPTKPTPSYTTPKPATRLARPSIGGISTPSRKSLGPTGTPLASSIKRPPSSLRQSNSMMAPPEVPPIPSAYGRTRSVTPSQMSGRITPSTPGAMMRRRTSMASSMSSSTNGERPSTPNLRSSSRQSFASSTSRQSHRSGYGGGEDVEELRKELDELRKREEETRTLLEGSEQLGREMEDRLEEKNRILEEQEERLRVLELESKKAVPVDEDGAGEYDNKLQERIIELERQLEQQTQQISKMKLESSRKSAAKEAELESLRERLAQSTKEHEEERLDLNQQIDKLRNAGQALCETYEEKIAEIELARLEAVELVETLQAQQSSSRSSSPPSSIHRSASTNLSASASHAAAIDAETALAEADHLRSKVAQLEEQLEDARTSLELELEEAKERKYKTGESEQALKNEIKQLKDIIDRSSQSESRFNTRIKELQIALDESQATLETERNELEGLRHDANGGNSEDLKRITRELASAKSDFATLQQESSKNSRLVDELRQDLRVAEKEIERLQRFEEKDRRGSIASSIGGKDEMTSAKDQIVGLKSIVSTLTDENQQLVDRSKTLEEDAAELRATQQALEATVENLMNELSSAPAQGSTADSTTVRRELEQLRSELKEVQRKSERDVKALNQEVSELEALVESKIYREDELETELEHYKSLLSKHSIPGVASTSNGFSSSKNAHRSASVVEDEGDEGSSCEMCGETGHDLDSCPEFLGSASPNKRRSPVSPTHSASSTGLHHSRTTSTLLIQANGKEGDGASQEWCDDCEEFGHSLDNCPLAAEIF